MALDMTKDNSNDAACLTTGERDYIRRELDMFFSTLPTVAEGFQLKTWRGGVKAGQPKVPPAGQSMLDRGLMRLDMERRPPRLLFTEAETRRITDHDVRPPASRSEEVHACSPGARLEGLTFVLAKTAPWSLRRNSAGSRKEQVQFALGQL